MNRMAGNSQATAVVTGAAGGIGRAVAHECARRGMRVALVDVDRARLDEAVSSIPGSSAHACDVADEGAVGDAVCEIVAAHGAVNLLVNNAGVSVAGPVEDLPLEAFRRALDVNFWGTVHCCRAMLPHLREAARREGRAAIANVLSDFALFSLPTKAPYASSKHAARAFTESLAAELHGSGVRVTAVYPGATATDLVKRGYAVDPSRRDLEAGFLAKGLAPEVVARRILAGVDAGRSRVLVGRDTRAIDLATRLAPALVQAGIRRFWRHVPFL